MIYMDDDSRFYLVFLGITVAFFSILFILIDVIEATVRLFFPGILVAVLFLVWADHRGHLKIKVTSPKDPLNRSMIAFVNFCRDNMMQYSSRGREYFKTQNSIELEYVMYIGYQYELNGFGVHYIWMNCDKREFVSDLMCWDKENHACLVKCRRYNNSDDCINDSERLRRLSSEAKRWESILKKDYNYAGHVSAVFYSMTSMDNSIANLNGFSNVKIKQIESHDSEIREWLDSTGVTVRAFREYLRSHK